MNTRRTFVMGGLLTLVVACSADERQPPPPQAQATGQPTTADSIIMPAFPEPRRGYLVARSAGLHDLSGVWTARAELCEDPAVMAVLAQQPGVGTVVLLRLPQPARRLATYPITDLDSGAPTPPAAQIGVQRFEGASAYAFQGFEGQVELTAMGDRVSGRYQVTLREITSRDQAKYAGVFESIMLDTLPAEQCQEWQRDLVLPDSIEGGV